MSLDEYRDQCLAKLGWAFGRLGLGVAAAELEPVAELIVQTMTGPWRYFHTPDHIFEVGGNEDPIEVLAALFHDIVYVQVDRGIHFNLAPYLTPFIEQDGEKLRLREADALPANDAEMSLIFTLFDFAPGQVLSPFGGQNELLSAFVAAKVLCTWLTPGLLSQVVVCIEATIPFRKPSADGTSVAEGLYARLCAANERFGLKLGEAEIIEAVIRSVRLSNRDVNGFGDTSARFLDNTWSLLPETNTHFKSPHSYTAREYRTSLQKTSGFLHSLDPKVIFRKFHGEPDEATYQHLVARADHNLAVGRLYLGTKIVTMALIEALSRRIGPDVPLTLMLGQLPTSGEPSGRLADLLPGPKRPCIPQGTVENEVFDLLDKGRSRESEYDLRNSPMSVFLVHAIGFDGVREELPRAQAFFDGKLSAEEYLKGGPTDAIGPLVQGIAELFAQRKQAITISARA
ncbi:hypothetical protein [Chondromyces apiculatus]|nr:hypothetical protein [Chondromyces apiculatus]